MNIPVTLVLGDVFCQHVLYCTVHLLNHAITLRVVWRGSRFLDTEEVTHFLKQLGFEVQTLVSVDTLRCLLIRKWECLSPFREVVSNNQDLLLTRFCRW